MEDSVARSKNVYEVNYIFVKQNDASKYLDMIYTDNKININDLSTTIKANLDVTGIKLYTKSKTY